MSTDEKMLARIAALLRQAEGTDNAHEAEAFMQRLYAADALQLRRWDDLAKVAGQRTPDLAHFLATAARVSLAA